MGTQTEHRVNGRSFKEWKGEVNQAIQDEIGFTADDLPDYGFYDAYEDAVEPTEAAAECIDAAGYY